MTTLAITGASGQLGRLVADQLLAAPGVNAADVVLLSRDPAKLSAYADQGAQVRAADFDAPETLAAAFAGVDTLLLISIDTLGEARVKAHAAAIDAAKAAGVTRIVYTSLPEPGEGNPAGVAPDHAATEQLLRDSGVTWTFLRNNLYADMQLQGIDQAAGTGRWVTNTGTGATAYVTRDDCAAVAVGALTGTGHDHQAYDVTGPEALTAEDLAALATAKRGEPVELIHVDDAEYAAGLESAGLPDFVAQLMASFGASSREGYLAAVSDTVATVGGRPATSLRSLV